MPGLIPTHPTLQERTAMVALLPPQRQVQFAAIADVLIRLDRCDTDSDRNEAFYVALIEHGGTWLPALNDADTHTRRGNHQHEIELLGAFGCGPTADAAIASWRKAAERMGAGL